jgi:hypothetical protein
LFLLIVIAALGCGWWVERRADRHRIANLREIIFRFGEYAQSRCGMTGRFDEHVGWLYINGKLSWSKDESMPKEWQWGP